MSRDLLWFQNLTLPTYGFYNSLSGIFILYIPPRLEIHVVEIETDTCFLEVFRSSSGEERLFTTSCCEFLICPLTTSNQFCERLDSGHLKRSVVA